MAVRIGKKTRLTKELETQLLDALESGMTLKGAADLVCISYARLLILMKAEGGKGDRLTACINRAQAIAESRLCQRAMDGTPKDALNMLIARFNHWDKKTDNMSTPDAKAEALLARLAEVPEQSRKRN